MTDGEYQIRIAGETGVCSDKAKGFAKRLRDENTVERITVYLGQIAHHRAVDGSNRQLGKSAGVNLRNRQIHLCFAEGNRRRFPAPPR